MKEFKLFVQMSKKEWIRHLKRGIRALTSRNQIISVQAGLYSIHNVDNPSTKNAHKEYTDNQATIDQFLDMIEYIQEDDLKLI